MAVSLLNHSATETVITVTCTFKNHVNELAETFRYHSYSINTDWKGMSYQRLLDVVIELQNTIQNIIDHTSSTTIQLENGQTSAIHDEREAARREAEARQQAAQPTYD